MTAADASPHAPAAEDAARASEAAWQKWIAEADPQGCQACWYVGWALDPIFRWFEDDCRRSHRAGRRARRAYERRRAEGGAP